MMMRMLAEGGAPILADGQREADSDNPRGYYELEAVKGTARDATWSREAPGKVVKVISSLLPHLPKTLSYRVLFMRRNLDQVVRSQRAMLDRLAADVKQADEDARRALADHLVEIDTWFETASHVRMLGVSYERVLADPAPQIERIIQFLELELDAAAMLRAVEPGLQRQR
jgi:hypothetical protein